MRILTFDVEEWFHLLDHEQTKDLKQWTSYESRIHANMDRILNFLEDKKLNATFFCLGWIAEKYPEVIKAIDDRGFEVGSHTYMHQLIYDQSRKEFKNDLESSVKVLEDAIGKKITSFRAPGFSLVSDVLWVFEDLIELGLELDSSIFPAKRAHGGISDFAEVTPHILNFRGHHIKEFPISIAKIAGRKIVYSGGGYFRFLPYSLIKSLTKTSDYVMTYFHPRDFDSDQPMIEGLSEFRKFKSYYGLKKSFTKLEQYVQDFDFIDIKEASSHIEWESARVIDM